MLLSVGLGTFMSALDASVVNTVLPVIREAFHAPIETIQWVVTTYLLVMGGLLLTFGRLGDLSLFRSRYFSIAVGSALVNYICVASILFLVPFYLIQGRGLSAAKAGILMTAQFLAMSLTAPVSGMISDRVGSRVPATAGMALMAGGLFLLSAMNGETSLYLVAISLTVTGVGVAIFVTPNNSAMLGAAPTGRKGIASGILATSRLLGMATGVSIAGAILVAVVGGRTTHDLPADRLFRAVHLGFLTAGIVASAGVVLSAARGDGNASGDRPSEKSAPVEDKG